MGSAVKSSFYWALTALQMVPDNDARANILSEKQQCHDLKKGQTSSIKDKASDGENVKPTFSRQSVTDHCSMDSCWIIINNKVYDVTRFLRMHPGGEDIILEHGGCDATSAFYDKGHSLEAFESLTDYIIGEIVPEERWPEKRKP